MGKLCNICEKSCGLVVYVNGKVYDDDDAVYGGDYMVAAMLFYSAFVFCHLSNLIELSNGLAFKLDFLKVFMFFYIFI